MHQNLKELIREKVSQYHPETVDCYKYLHQHPELSFQEKQTSLYVEKYLKQWGIGYRNNIGGYGILAWVEGSNPQSKTIALRADMDALPIVEQNEVTFRSANEGVMHACGHDTHTTSLLAVARIINELKDKFEGTVLFVFQPGEEKHPGGARLMLEDGIFDTYKPDVMIAQHAYVDCNAGEVAFAEGVVMASADEIHIRVKGKGGHGALPHELNDTVLATSQIVVSMQQVVSRRSNPFKPAVLTIGKFIADGATNIIPNEVVLAGTFRCMDEPEREKLKAAIEEVAVNTAVAYGCQCEIDVYDGYPCTLNNAQVTEIARSFAVEFLDDDKVKTMPARMTAEDFGFFSQLYPSTFYRFGIQGKKYSTGLHTPTFLIDEEALKTSVGAMAYIALRYCSVQ